MNKEEFIEHLAQHIYIKYNEYSGQSLHDASVIAKELYDKIVSRVELPVKPDCEYTKRPTIKSYFPEDMTVGMINNTFLENKELYNYIQAIDNYIDELESSRVEPEIKLATYGQWINLEKQEPPKGIYILTWHQLDRIQMQKYDGKMFNDPITCPVDKNGEPIGFTSSYPKEVIKYWMPLPSKPLA